MMRKRNYVTLPMYIEMGTRDDAMGTHNGDSPMIVFEI